MNDTKENFIGFLTNQVKGLLTENENDILRGYHNAGEDTFSVSASIKRSGTKEVIESDTTIGFTLEKVKANSKFTIDMNQLSMFSNETGEAMAANDDNTPQAA